MAKYKIVINGEVVNYPTTSEKTTIIDGKVVKVSKDEIVEMNFTDKGTEVSIKKTQKGN